MCIAHGATNEKTREGEADGESSLFIPRLEFVGSPSLGYFCLWDYLSIVHAVTFQLQVEVLLYEGYGKHAGEWAGKADRQWKQPTTEMQKTKEVTNGREEYKIKLLRFPCRRWSISSGPVSWRLMTAKWWRFSQSSCHSTIGTWQTEYHEALPLLVNDEVRCDCTFANDGSASWYWVCWVPMVEWRLDCENCRHLTVVGLYDTGPRLTTDKERNVAE